MDTNSKFVLICHWDVCLTAVKRLREAANSNDIDTGTVQERHITLVSDHGGFFFF